MFVIEEKDAKATHTILDYLTIAWRLVYLSAWMAATIYSIYNISLFKAPYVLRIFDDVFDLDPNCPISTHLHDS